MNSNTNLKFLFVCLGNICRSPLGEGILRSKIKFSNLNWEVESCGTSNEHEGEPPHEGSIKVAKKYNIDISKQVSKPFKKEYINKFDYIYVMDESNYQNVAYICGQSFNDKKVDLLLNLLDDVKDKNVPDPWYSETDEAFNKVFLLIDKACDKIIKKFK